MKRKINIQLEFESASTIEEIDAAIKKGIIYGLDVKRIAAPNNIAFIKLTEEEQSEEILYKLGDDSIHIVGSHGVQINEKIIDKELFEYRITYREDFIDDLIGWISEARESSKFIMKQDLEMLMKVEDDYIFSSISTNDYIYVGCKEFNETCKELLELNEKYN